MKPYKQFIGRLIDQGKPALDIQRRILRAHDQGEIDLPIKIWGMADRAVLMVDSQTGQSRQAMIEMVNEGSPLPLLLNPHWVRFLRNALTDPEFSIKDAKKRAKWQTVVIQSFPVTESLWGEYKHKTLLELGLIPWSEEQFQRVVFFVAKARRKNRHASYERLRLWVNEYTDLNGKYLKRQIPFDYLLGNDNISFLQKQSARRVSEAILGNLKNRDIKIGMTITAAQARTIEYALAWLIPPPPRSFPRHLAPLLPLSKEFTKINWGQFERLLTFIKNQQGRPANHELLQDFVDGRVDSKGRGHHQR